MLSTAAGYAFAKYDFRAKEAVFWTILGGVLVPATVIALPLYFLLNAVGLTGSYWSVLLPCMVSPFGVYLARIHANASVPDEVNTISAGRAPISRATWARASSTASRAAWPKPWTEDGLPQICPIQGSIASRTLGSMGVVAL